MIWRQPWQRKWTTTFEDSSYTVYIYILTSTDVTTGLLGSAQKYSMHIMFRCKINGLTTASLDKAKLQACLQNTMEMSKLGSRNTKTMDHWTNRLWGALIRDSPNMTSWFQVNYIKPLDISLFKHLSGYSSCLRIIARRDPPKIEQLHPEHPRDTLPLVTCEELPVSICRRCGHLSNLLPWIFKCRFKKNRQDLHLIVTSELWLLPVVVLHLTFKKFLKSIIVAILVGKVIHFHRQRVSPLFDPSLQLVCTVKHGLRWRPIWQKHTDAS